MKFAIAATLLSISGAFAAPAPEPATEVVNMMATAAPQWTIQSLKRPCNKANTQCDWSFSIYPGTGKAVACKYSVKGSKASERSGGPANCGDYTVTSGWSGQFGPGNGFTTLSVVNNKSKKIVFPAYTDKQLAGGKTVKPDQKYTSQALP